MVTKLAMRIIESDSPIAMAEAFITAMNGRAAAILEGVKIQHAGSILLENAGEQDYDNKLDAAIDYVIRFTQQFGLESIAEGVEQASPIFSVDIHDLIEVFDSALSVDDTVSAPVETAIISENKDFLVKLDRILESNEGNILGFKDRSSAYVTPMEASSLLELFAELSPENQKTMIEKLVSSKKDFDKLVVFSEQTFTGAN